MSFAVLVRIKYLIIQNLFMNSSNLLNRYIVDEIPIVVDELALISYPNYSLHNFTTDVLLPVEMFMPRNVYEDPQLCWSTRHKIYKVVSEYDPLHRTHLI